MSGNNGYLTCPYNNHHKVLPNRLAVHLTRCGQKYPSFHYLRCPFNTTHVFTVEQISGHIMECPNRQVHSEVTKQAEKCTPGQYQEVEAGEDWDAEPPAEPYIPIRKLKDTFVIMNPQGGTRGERRAFRQRELQRWMNSEKF